MIKLLNLFLLLIHCGLIMTPYDAFADSSEKKIRDDYVINIDISYPILMAVSSSNSFTHDI
jgi:hypothetical protein